MKIRYTTPPRIEWKEKVGSRWVGRTLSVSPKNLRKYGIPAPASKEEVTSWHAKRLLAVLKQMGEEDEFTQKDLSLTEMIEVFLSNFRGTPGNRQRKERVFFRPATNITGQICKGLDISLVSFLGNVMLDAVTGEDLVRYQNFLVDRGYSSMSVRGYLVDVRTLFNYAVRHGYVLTSAARSIKLPASDPSEEIYYLNPDQVSCLFKLVGDPLRYDPEMRNRMPREKNGRKHFKPTRGNNVLSLVLPGFLYLGLRRSELIDLRWSDVDLEKSVAIVRGARKNPSKRSRKRAVPIPPQLQGYLTRKSRESKFVFVNSQGEPFNGNSLNSALRRFRQTYGNELGFHFDFQCLRRTYGSLLYQSGYSLDQVSELLGHSNIGTTRKWYCGMRAESQRERVSLAFQEISGDEKAEAS